MACITVRPVKKYQLMGKPKMAFLYRWTLFTGWNTDLIRRFINTMYSEVFPFLYSEVTLSTSSTVYVVNGACWAIFWIWRFLRISHSITLDNITWNYSSLYIIYPVLVGLWFVCCCSLYGDVQVSSERYFRKKTGTRAELSTYGKLAGKLRRMKESNPDG